MAGKCNFLAGRLFGKVGRAPLKAIYSRAHSNMSQLDKPTRSALHALLHIIQHCKPMRLPLQIQHRHFAIIYADASYLAGDLKLRPGDGTPEGWKPHDFAQVENSWGAVIFPPGESDRAWCFQGRLSQEILKQFSSNTASSTSWKPGSPSSHRWSANPSWATSTSSAATTKQPVMLLLRE